MTTCPALGGGVLGEQWLVELVASELQRRTARLEAARDELVDAMTPHRVVTPTTADRHRRVDLVRQTINLVAVRRRWSNAHFEHFGQLMLLQLPLLLLSTPVKSTAMLLLPTTPSHKLLNILFRTTVA